MKELIQAQTQGIERRQVQRPGSATLLRRGWFKHLDDQGTVRLEGVDWWDVLADVVQS